MILAVVLMARPPPCTIYTTAVIIAEANIEFYHATPTILAIRSSSITPTLLMKAIAQEAKNSTLTWSILIIAGIVVAFMVLTGLRNGRAHKPNPLQVISGP